MSGERIRRSPLLVVPLFLLLYGYGTIDVADFYRLSAAPLQLNADAGKQFLHSSPLPYFLGYPITRVFGPRVSYFMVFGAGLLLCGIAAWRLAAVRYAHHRNDAMLMLLATPVLIVMTQYIGKSDPFLVAFVLLLMTVTHPLAQIVCASLVVMSHFEIGLIVLASAAFLQLLPRWATAIGAAIGAAAVLGYVYYLLPVAPQSRADVAILLVRESLASVATTPVLHALFTFGPFWICVAAVWPMDWRWLVTCAATLLLASVTIDFTRVFTLVGLPLAIVVVDRAVAGLRANAGARPPRWVSALPLLALCQAHLIGRYVYDSRLPELMARLVDVNLRQ